MSEIHGSQNFHPLFIATTLSSALDEAIAAPDAPLPEGLETLLSQCTLLRAPLSCGPPGEHPPPPPPGAPPPAELDAIAASLRAAFASCPLAGPGAHATFLRYAALASSPHALELLPTATRRHFFPAHLVSALEAPGGQRTLAQRADCALRLWLFDRHCALEALEKLLLFRVHLIAERGCAQAAGNALVVASNKHLVRGETRRRGVVPHVSP